MKTSAPWTRQQLALIRKHPDLTAAEIKPLLDAQGATRTLSSIRERRRTLGLKSPRAPAGAVCRAAQADTARISYAERMAGWPVLRGTPEQRERRYLKALYEGLAAEHRRIAAQRVAA